MKYQLLNPPNNNYNTIETVLTNRGIKYENIHEYLNTTDDVINDYKLLGEENLKEAYLQIKDAIENNKNVLVIVDSDCDGFTSSAVLINYLHDWNSEWINNHLTYVMHEGKQHGLKDIDIEDNIHLVIVPDAGSNNYEQHKSLVDREKTVIVLDHHEAEKISEHAIIINNQLSAYPNKQLSGVGVVWQFCRYIDEQRETDYADNYLDLVALGLDFWANISFPAAAGVKFFGNTN